jgi:putative DNA primase/helicase
LKSKECKAGWDFPFGDEASQAAAISLTILPFARELVRGPTPLYLLDKPNAGTGATTLAKALTYPFIGSEIAVKSWTSTEDERRKQITAHLMSGGGPYFFDNLGGMIDSNVLASVLTSTVWSDRLLQTSQNVELTNHSTWIGTGNNPRFNQQILRRIARIRLVTLVENPSERTGWRHPDLLEWIAVHRTEYVQHILTILIAWINSGKPMYSGKPLNSYESWSNVLGGILEFIEVPGFLENLKELRTTLDPEREMTREFIEVWWNDHAGEAKTAANFTSDFSSVEIAGVWEAPTRQGSITKAGSWLSTLKDRVFEIDGIKVVVSHSGRNYYLKEVKEKAA